MTGTRNSLFQNILEIFSFCSTKSRIYITVTVNEHRRIGNSNILLFTIYECIVEETLYLYTV